MVARWKEDWFQGNLLTFINGRAWHQFSKDGFIDVNLSYTFWHLQISKKLLYLDTNMVKQKWKQMFVISYSKFLLPFHDWWQWIFSESTLCNSSSTKVRHLTNDMVQLETWLKFLEIKLNVSLTPVVCSLLKSKEYKMGF